MKVSKSQFEYNQKVMDKKRYCRMEDFDEAQMMEAEYQWELQTKMVQEMNRANTVLGKDWFYTVEGKACSSNTGFKPVDTYNDNQKVNYYKRKNHIPLPPNYASLPKIEKLRIQDERRNKKLKNKK